MDYEPVQIHSPHLEVAFFLGLPHDAVAFEVDFEGFAGCGDARGVYGGRGFSVTECRGKSTVDERKRGPVEDRVRAEETFEEVEVVVVWGDCGFEGEFVPPHAFEVFDDGAGGSFPLRGAFTHGCWRVEVFVDVALDLRAEDPELVEGRPRLVPLVVADVGGRHRKSDVVVLDCGGPPEPDGESFVHGVEEPEKVLLFGVGGVGGGCSRRAVVAKGLAECDGHVDEHSAEGGTGFLDCVGGLCRGG